MTRSIPERIRILAVAGALILLFCAVAGAQTQRYYGQRVVDLTYEGVVTVDTALIRRVSGIQRGEVFNAGVSQEAIRQLYALSLFSDISLDAKMVSGGIRITLQVKEYPRLDQVHFAGNARVKKKDIEEHITLVHNQVVTPDQIKQARLAVRDVYKEKGYFFADINPRLEPRGDSAVDLVFDIIEGQKLKIKRVTILGAEQLRPGDVRGKMENKADNWYRSGAYKPDEYEEDLKKIVTYYKKEGFLDAAVLNDTFFVNDTLKGLELQITVHEGRRYYFGETTFDGYTLFGEWQLLRQLKWIPGDVYSKEKFEETMAGLYTLLHDQGRLYGQVRDEQVPRDSIVDIHFHIVENQPAQIRFVEIQGNNKTKEKVIRRELSLFPGATYRRSDLERSMRDLMVMNYFENVIPDMQVLPNGDVDLIVEVQEKSTGQISVGGGYSGQDRFVGTIGFGVPNFLGNGQNLSFNAEKGSRRSSFDISFTEPWFRDTRTSVGVDLFRTTRRSFDNNYDEDRNGLGLRIGRRLRWPDRFTSVFLRGRIQDVGFSNFNEIYIENWRNALVVGPDPDAEWPQRLASATITLMRDSRDRAQFATEGSRVSLSFEYAGDAIGGHWHYHKTLIDVAKYFPLYKEIALSLKARWGFISPTQGSDLVPYSEKFQVGGVNGDGFVRGYEEGTGGVRFIEGEQESVSYPSDRPGDFNPVDSEGNLRITYDRSSSMTIYSAELQLPIAPPSIYGVVFADAGRGFGGVSGWRFSTGLWRSAGFGGRMVVPGVGTIGFDMAYGFDDRYVGGWRPHFQIGRQF